MDIVKSNLDIVFDNKYTSTVLSMFLVIYGGLAAPKLPKFISDLFATMVFRVLILSLIVFSANKDARISIMMAVVFIMTMDALRNQKMFENFDCSQDLVSDFEDFTEVKDEICSQDACLPLSKIFDYFRTTSKGVLSLVTDLPIEEGKTKEQHNEFIKFTSQQLQSIEEESSKDPYNATTFKELHLLHKKIMRKIDRVKTKTEDQIVRKEQLIEINKHIDCHLENIKQQKSCREVDDQLENVENFGNMENLENIADSSLEKMASYGDDNEQYETV